MGRNGNQESSLGGRTGIDATQSESDSDQTASDADQTASDADQTASDSDEAGSHADQASSDADQATADRERQSSNGNAEEAGYQAAKAQRAESSLERDRTALDRTSTAQAREPFSRDRDAKAARRDDQARVRDARAAALEHEVAAFDSTAAREFEALRQRAASDRTAAAADRERAAHERTKAAHDREILESKLHTAYLDDLTGAYGRDLGIVTISRDLARARRGDRRYVVVFVDLDGLKTINDRDGHAAGDDALRTVVTVMRERLRSFDSIYRYGGDEFVAGMAAVDVDDAERRFADISAALEPAGLSISVGFASLEDGDSAEDITACADRDLYRRRAASRG
jgi:diguanylate cyclase (GGDEF)-like protein